MMSGLSFISWTPLSAFPDGTDEGGCLYFGSFSMGRDFGGNGAAMLIGDVGCEMPFAAKAI